MAWWDDKATRLQRDVRYSEDQIGEFCSEEDAWRAAVHGRQDLVLIVSHLSSVNRQLATVKLLLSVLVVIALYVAFKL